MSTNEELCLKSYIQTFMLILNVDFDRIEKSVLNLFNIENFEEEFYKLTHVVDLYINLTRLLYEIICLYNFKSGVISNTNSKSWYLLDKNDYFYSKQNYYDSFTLFISNDIFVGVEFFIKDKNLFYSSMNYSINYQHQLRCIELKLISMFYYENDIRLLLNDKPKDVIDVIFSYFYGDTYIKNKNKIITLKDFLKENLKKELVKINVNKYSLI